MIRARQETCASCARFPLRAAAENKGVAKCGGYEKPANWNDHACVLYNRASDVEQRKRLVEQLRAAEKKERKNDE